MVTDTIIEKIKDSAIHLNESAYDHLLEKIGDAQIVLLGEATHGTREFYEIRAEITKRLILEKQFNAVAIEGDWPDAYMIHRYINGHEITDARDALTAFNKFPTWMWQNVPILKLITWLKNHNETYNNAIGFYGLDLYSLYKSINAIISVLERVDPQGAEEAKKSYSCFDQVEQDPQIYGYSVLSGLSTSCQNEVITELKRLQEAEWRLIQEKKITEDEGFYVIQNARVVKNSEAYFRSLFINEVSNWNLRDSHMMETLEAIIKHYKEKGIKNPKVIVWAHNSHIGNAAATQMHAQGEFNLGELVKEKYGTASYNLGFTTYAGTVTAASAWQMPVECKRIRNAIPGSYEHLFHEVGIPEFLLTLENKKLVPPHLLERAIGVVYAPATERQSHYFYADLANQFDAIIHCDITYALEPLDKTTLWLQGEEAPATYPSGL